MKINDKRSKNSDKLPQCTNLYLGKVQAFLAQGKAGGTTARLISGKEQVLKPGVLGVQNGG